MDITLQIRDKLYNDICEFCERNSFVDNEKMVQWIEDGFYTEKYGDMNEIMGLKKKEKTAKKKETEKADKPKEIEKEKKSLVVIIDKPVVEAEEIQIDKVRIEEKVEEAIEEKPEKKTTTRRRLKSK